MEQVYIGADVSKGYADFCFTGPDGTPLPQGRRCDDTPAGHTQVRELITTLRSQHPALRVTLGIEASGGLERNWLRLGRSLAQAEDQIFQLNPLAVKRHRERHLHQNVTDQSSARDIAAYLREGLRAAEQPYAPELEGARTLYRALTNQIKRSTVVQNELQNLLPTVHPELVQYCRQGFPQWFLAVLDRYPVAPRLARAQTKTLTKLPHVDPERAAALIAAARQSVASLTDADTAYTIRALVKELRTLAAAIDRGKQLLQTRLGTEREVQRLRSIPGIGPWVAVCLRLEAGSLTRFHSANALVAFAGLDPRNHQSGDLTRRGSISHRGRAEIRAVLYMAVITALRHNPVIKSFYARLRARGKSHLTAAVACMAKLLRLAYACVLRDEPFDAAKQETTRQRYAEQAAARNQARAAGAATEPEALTAPVSRREAHRRKTAANAPQATQSPQARGHAAAAINHATQSVGRHPAAAPVAASTITDVHFGA